VIFIGSVENINSLSNIMICHFPFNRRNSEVENLILRRQAFVVKINFRIRNGQSRF
jgi:hypothetical protein